MSTPSTAHHTPASRGRQLALQTGFALLGTAILAVSAHIKVPFWPVPMTMQTYVVLALALMFGARAASMVVGLYLLEGALGLPVFAGGTGPAVLAGPTGGYLAAFLVVAVGIGHLSDRRLLCGPVSATAGAFLGMIVIYVIGVGWLSIAYMPLQEAITVGALPFLVGDALKAILAGVTAAVWRRAVRSGS